MSCRKKKDRIISQNVLLYRRLLIITNKCKSFSTIPENIWKKEKKFNKTRQSQRTLISASSYFQNASTKVQFLEDILKTRLYLHLNLRFFQYFLVLSGSAIRDAISAISFRFTFGKSDFY